ncbi:Gaa1-domain-containing protein [Irpex rosettiformis]|uniref:Gaa1-domain-containing protein n=1 Tax=Irpex rosettiformis TaxID=378272 RepID=A0ACB8TVS2_9APHY|nr:Gaa1-domain-containing protein [Irpex rosettiformis]
MPPRIVEIIRGMRGGGDRNVARLRRKRAITHLCWKSWPILSLTLLVTGYAWMLTIPSTLHGQKTYIDENALQPSQVTTYWGWTDVHRTDGYLDALEALRDRNASGNEYANYISTEFRKLGVPAATQNYQILTSSEPLNGTNAFAILSAPRASGAEAMIVSASRISMDGHLNLRGISTVLSLAAFLKGYSLWAKDLIFIVSDGYLDGMQAWLTAYHGLSQSNIISEPLTLSSGSIWTALNIDYPGHSFSHLGIFFEGLNGRLPNQDLLNSFQKISLYTGGVPVTVYDHYERGEFPDRDLADIPWWVPHAAMNIEAVKEYVYRAKNIMRHVGYQARGRASGVHGLMHQFRIDAFTMFAIPSAGPHGFHALGRVLESTLRTTNNLLERLHASFFFYLLVGTTTFMKIGSYLPAPVLVSTAMLFSGLGEWARARWAEEPVGPDEKEREPGLGTQWVQRKRPVLPAILFVIGTHLNGVLLFCLIASPWASRNKIFTYPFLVAQAFLFPLLLSLATTKTSSPSTTAPTYQILKSINLCLASTVISITSVLNFSLAATLAILLGPPLIWSGPGKYRHIKAAGYCVLGLGWLLLLPQEVQKALWNWEVLGVWFAPFVCTVYVPLVVQAAIATVLIH